MTWKPDICIYHGFCDDGFGAAWAIWRRWGDTVSYVPGVYGKPLPPNESLRGLNVLFVDFSAKKPELLEMAKVAQSIVILDHHKTAEEDLREWNGAMVYPEDVHVIIAKHTYELGVPIVAVFDMNRSGAPMAWEFAHGRNATVPLMLSLIEDRDLWRFKLEQTKEFSAALRTYPMDFKTWSWIERHTGTLIDEGATVLRAHKANIEKFLRDVYTARIGEHVVPVVNVPYHYASDMAHILLGVYPDAPFAAAWFIRGDGQIQFSLRSEDSRFDVSAVAKAFGGGGHRNAAGFQTNDLTMVANIG